MLVEMRPKADITLKEGGGGEGTLLLLLPPFLSMKRGQQKLGSGVFYMKEENL